MKAFLLAAGYGTRLRPLTDTIPKCLVPIQGEPLLLWWMRLFERHGIQEVLVNTHYLPDAVRSFISNYNARNSGTRLVEFYERELLGSGGTIRDNRGFVQGEEEFLICYADNLTNVDLTKLLEFHRGKGAEFTMGLFHAPHPEACGIARLDKNGMIQSFVEKPKHPEGNLANAGIYVAGQRIFQEIPEGCPIDFGKDVLPKLVGRMHGYEIGEYLLDIGTMENYQRAQKEWLG